MFSEPSDSVDQTSATGGDYFRGGVSNIQYDKISKRIYFSIFDYGLYRQKTGAGYERIFDSECVGHPACSLSGRTEFAVAPLPNGKLRIYLGDSGISEATFWRTDDANAAAPSFTELSNSDPSTTGFDSFNYCSEQCSYDMPVASPPGKPDEVWLGGQMQYDEIFTSTPPSNGRAVQRSTNAGVRFTDMTDDAQSPPIGMHPDQHAIVFTGDGSVAFIGSDGGVVRTSGKYANTSSSCDSRGLSGDDLDNCKRWLSSIPTVITSLNDGLATLQFQSVSVNPSNPVADIMGGTQDNGTWVMGAGSQ